MFEFKFCFDCSFQKSSDEPPLSYEIKRQLETLDQQLKPDSTKQKDWQTSYTNVYKQYEQKRIQIIQDEYLAKLFQNQEFLNELKQNEDFMQTLDSGLIDYYNYYYFITLFTSNLLILLK